jgi:hypothetical protein
MKNRVYQNSLMPRPWEKLKPGSTLIYTAAEKVDYTNGLGVSFCFERHTKDAIMLEFRIVQELLTGQSAEQIVKKLRGLADVIENECVKKVKEG